MPADFKGLCLFGGHVFLYFSTKNLIETAGQIIRRRSMSYSARDMLPPSATTLSAASSKKTTTSQRRQLRDTELSMASQAALRGIAEITKATLKSDGLRYLSPLLQSDFVSQIVEKVAKRKKKKVTPSQMTHSFWSSASAVLEMDKDSLWKLPEEVKQITDIYPNRTLAVPPVVKVDAKKLPQNVKDNKTSAWGAQAINALAAWGAYNSKGKGIKVAVLDTGVDASHPDLKDKIEDWAEFDRNGGEISGSTPHDSGEHGTHCAGTIVGGNASGQWIGVAPDAKIAAGLVLKKGSGTDAQIMAGIQWAIEKGVDVISMSLGGVRFSPDVVDMYTRAIIGANRMGIPVVVAIGNEGSETSGTPGNDYFAFAVGATDYRDQSAGFSGGRTQVINESRYISRAYLPLVYSKPEVTAPGVAVKSSVPRGKYEFLNGTSMAIPHVAGAIALLLSATDIRRKVSADHRAYTIQDLLIGSVEELGEVGQDHRYGYGRIDVLRAIGFAKDLGY
jgi:subtilisin family serine protease